MQNALRICYHYRLCLQKRKPTTSGALAVNHAAFIPDPFAFFEFPWQASQTNGRAALHHDTTPPKELTVARPNIDPRLARSIMQAINPKLEERTPSLDVFLKQIQGVTSATV